MTKINGDSCPGWYKMDNTATYIKMADCPEIQGLRTKDNWQNGDYYSTVFNDGVFMVYPLDVWDVPLYIRHRSECIFLPRQDQLQEMIGRGISSLESYAFHFGDWCLENYHRAGQSGSMEQLWLIYVMRWKFNKAWNGTEWKEVV